MDSSLRTDEEIAEIYYRHVDTVYRVCFSYMKNTADTEDMVQETFLKLLSIEKAFESENHEKAWLIVTAANTCKDELRRRKRRAEHSREYLPGENSGIAPDEKDNSVLNAILELSVKYKEVVYLYYYEGYQTPEIAGMLHRPEATIRTWLSRARKLLKKNGV